MKVELNERDWDHVLLALEHSCDVLAKSAAVAEECGIPNSGTRRATERYAEIAASVAKQLGFEPQSQQSTSISPGEQQ